MSRAFLRTACGDYPGSAGASGDLVRDVRGMVLAPPGAYRGPRVGWPRDWRLIGGRLVDE
jgi:hypothetical protein